MLVRLSPLGVACKVLREPAKLSGMMVACEFRFLTVTEPLRSGVAVTLAIGLGIMDGGR